MTPFAAIPAQHHDAHAILHHSMQNLKVQWQVQYLFIAQVLQGYIYIPITNHGKDLYWRAQGKQVRALANVQGEYKFRDEKKE
jgi:hypothetical protein